MWKHEPDQNRWYERWAIIALFALWAVAPGWAYALPSGTGDVLFTLSDGGNLILTEDNPKEAYIGGEELEHIRAENLILTTDRDIDVNAEITTPKGDFIAVADNGNNTLGDFNVAPGVEITSARDIDVTAPTMNAQENAFNKTRDLILNGVVLGGNTGTSPPPEGSADAGSSQEGVLNGFILQFFDNALIGC